MTSRVVPVLISLAFAIPVIAWIPLGAGCASSSTSGASTADSEASRQQRTFASVNDAVSALIDAARADDRSAIRNIFGPDVELLESGDRTQDHIDFQRLVAAYDLNHFLLDNGDGTYSLVLGLQEWEFPAPITPVDGRWRFDTNAGIDELITRTIGMNELHVIDACAAYVQAQQNYFAMDPDDDRVPEFARTLRSPPGTRQGLYWPDVEGQPLSPLGPLFSQAVASGQLDERITTRQPYRGYYYRVLTSQAAGAPGGAMNYIDADDNMTGGFALIAWPAAYGETGVMSFIVARDGVVLQRDLGPDTASAVEKIAQYDPTGWEPTQP